MPRRSRLAKTTVHKLAPLSYAPSLTHFDRPRLIGVQGINVSSTAAPSSAIWLVTVGLRAGDRLILHRTAVASTTASSDGVVSTSHAPNTLHPTFVNVQAIVKSHCLDHRGSQAE